MVMATAKVLTMTTVSTYAKRGRMKRTHSRQELGKSRTCEDSGSTKANVPVCAAREKTRMHTRQEVKTKPCLIDTKPSSTSEEAA
jgi:hypothetical protein